WIPREVLVGPELGGVHEDGHGNGRREVPGGADERRVAVVQVAHGGNERERAVDARFLAGAAEIVGCFHHRDHRSRTLAFAARKRRRYGGVMRRELSVYYSPSCAFSMGTVSFLVGRGADFRLVNLDEDPARRARLEKRIAPPPSTPGPRRRSSSRSRRSASRSAAGTSRPCRACRRRRGPGRRRTGPRRSRWSECRRWR